MKIESLTLTNFRGIRDMTLEFNERLTVLVGVNGAGKSTVLDALAILLSWGVARITDPDEKGKEIRPSEIMSGTNYSWASLTVENGGSRYMWSLLRRRPGFEVEVRDAVRGETEFATPIRRRITETNAECSLPLMVLYPVRRVVRDPFPRRPRKAEGTLEAYEGALSGQARFDAFFEWFREQDDIANEERSRREWFIRNRLQIDNGIDRLIDVLTECVKKAEDDANVLARFREKFGRREGRLTDDPKAFFWDFYDDLVSGAIRLLGKALRPIIGEIKHVFFRTLESEYSPQRSEIWPDFIEWALLLAFASLSSDNTEPARKRSLLSFLRELLAFSAEWSLFWMSKEGRHRLGNAIRERFPDAACGREEWNHKTKSLVASIRSILATEASRRQHVINSEGYDLAFVSRTIESSVPEFTNLRISRKPKPRMLVEKDGTTFDINQLSDGEKCLIAMIGDLARRLVIANPTMENPLEGEGVVLIDEIDLHLHPTWQRMVAPRLIATFPNVQFIITTHSPQVLSHVEDKSVFLLRQTDKGIVHVPLSEAYGQSYERLLEDVFGVATRPDEIQAELDELFDLIQRERIQEAQDKLQELRRRIGTDPDLVRAGFLLHRKEEVD